MLVGGSVRCRVIRRAWQPAGIPPLHLCATKFLTKRCCKLLPVTPQPVRQMGAGGTITVAGVHAGRRRQRHRSTFPELSHEYQGGVLLGLVRRVDVPSP